VARVHGVSKDSVDYVGIAVYQNGVLVDPDSNVARLTLTRVADNAVIYTNDLAEREGVGLYRFRVDTAATALKGEYAEHWTYSVGGNNRVFDDEFKVVDPQPFWDALTPEEKQIVDDVYFYVSDGYDSRVDGGPYAWEKVQGWNAFEVIARLMTIGATTRINLAPPVVIDPPLGVGEMVNQGAVQFPPKWYGLLHKATFVELVKHLRRLYLEQPEQVNIPTAYLSRRDYWERWDHEYQEEKAELDELLLMLKRQYQYSVFTHSLLVAGGIYPAMWFNPARPRWPYIPTRF
jgi:hypothetical protein